MSANSDAERVREVLSDPKQRSVGIDGLLGQLLGEERSAKVLAKNASHPAVRTGVSKTTQVKTSAARNPPKTKTSLSSLGEKERKTLATDVVNLCLKSLSARSKALGAEVQIERNPIKPGSRTAGQQSPIDAGVNTIVTCFRIALDYLIRLKGQKSGFNDYKLEQASLAFITKLVALGLVSDAVKELGRLRTRLRGSADRAGSRASFHNLFTLDMSEPELSKLDIVWSYYTTLLKTLTRFPDLASSDDLAQVLALEHPYGPFANIRRMTTSGGTEAEVCERLEMLATLLKGYIQAARQQDGVSGTGFFQLHVIVLRIRESWWKSSSHNVDVVSEVLEPFASALRSLRSSKFPPAEQWITCRPFAEDWLGKWSQHTGNDSAGSVYNKICMTLSKLAESANDEHAAASWIRKADSTGPGATQEQDLRLALVALRRTSALSRDDAIHVLHQVRQIRQSGYDLSGNFRLLEEARSGLVSTLLRTDKDSGNVKPTLSLALLECVRSVILSCPKQLSGGPSTWFEAGLLAVDTNLEQASPDVDNLESFLSELTGVRKQPDVLRHGSLLIGLSNAQWSLARLLKTLDISRSLTMATAGVRTLRLLPEADQNIGQYLEKILAVCGDLIDAGAQQQAIECLGLSLHHAGFAAGLNNVAKKSAASPLTETVAAWIAGSHCEGFLSSTRRISAMSREPIVPCLLRDVDEDVVSGLCMIWLCNDDGQDSKTHKDTSYSIQHLLSSKLCINNSKLYCQILVRARLLSIKNLRVLSGKAAAKVWAQEDISKYPPHHRHALEYLHNLHRQQFHASALVNAITWWLKICAQPETMKGQIDEPDILFELAMCGSLIFDAISKHRLRDQCVDICSSIEGAGRPLSVVQRHRLLVTKIRQSLQRGDSTGSRTMLNHVPACSTLSYTERVSFHGLRFEVACASDDVNEIKHLTEISSLNPKGLHRQDKIAFHSLQAKIGRHLASFLMRQRRYPEATHLARSSLSLLRSVTTAAKDVQRNDASPDRPDSGCEMDKATKGLSNLSLSASAPAPYDMSISGMAHDSFECMILLSELSSLQGIRDEAVYYLEQADVAAKDARLESWTATASAARFRIETKTGVRNRSSRSLDGANGSVVENVDEIAALALNVASGDWHVRFGEHEAALQDYELAERLIVPQQVPAAVDSSATAAASTKRSPVATKAKATARSKKAAVVAPPKKVARSRTASTKSLKPPSPAKVKHDEYQSRSIGLVKQQRGLALLGMKRLEEASAALQLLSPALVPDAIALLLVKLRIATQAMYEMLNNDVSLGSLIESAIAIPCLDNMSMKQVQAKKKGDTPVHQLLLEIGDHIVSLPGLNLRPNISQSYELSALSTSFEFLKSALQIQPLGSRVGGYLEAPSNTAFRDAVEHVRFHKRKANIARDTEELHLTSAASKYDLADDADRISDILPPDWSVVSLTLNEAGTELWLSQYDKDQQPFSIRLPMSRHRDDNLEPKDEFTLSTARQELADIIIRSDYTCHNPPNSSVKGGKTKWWDEREALDQRMHELLINMEEIWLGGFKGVLSPTSVVPAQLARFAKSLDLILDRHLPSRQGVKIDIPRVRLHERVLSLFVRLNMDAQPEERLDEHVMDLLFFVVDALHYSGGETNALDEIDFDQMAVEIIDAMKSYHEAVQLDPETRYLILRLDKRLHCFPWESMPCLQGLSITRVCSLAQLQERILALQERPRISRHNGGTFILNSSSDLGRTEEVLLPHLSTLQQETKGMASPSWKGIVRQKVSEHAFSDALASSDMTLYFGHGSGSQYIRPRTIEKLEKCSRVVWLMGCSSGTVKENGDLEPTSVPMSYLLAGSRPQPGVPLFADTDRVHPQHTEGLCLAVVGTLWDVTDKDIDRFSVTMGQQWGLFHPEISRSSGPAPDTSLLQPPKTPKTKARSGPTATPAPKTPCRSRSDAPAVKRNLRTKTVELGPKGLGGSGDKIDLASAVARSRDVCYLRYLNGAASVVYGVPVSLAD